MVEFTVLELEDPKLMHISRRTLKILRHRQWFRGEDGACDVDLGLAMQHILCASSSLLGNSEDTEPL